jgi:hypothetical protein
VVVGRRLADGQVELRRRDADSREDVPIGELAARL